MLNEVTPNLLTRLASVKLTLKGMLAEVEAIEGELRRREEEEKQKLSLPAAEWIPIEEVTKLLGYARTANTRRWALTNGVTFHTLSKGKVFFSRAELDAKLKASPSGQGKPVIKHVEKTVKQPSRKEIAERLVLRLVEGSHHGS
jgi:hypothetical protein